MTEHLVRELDQSPTTSPTPFLSARRPTTFKKRIRPYQRPAERISTSCSPPPPPPPPPRKMEVTRFINTKSGLKEENNTLHPALSECNLFSKKIVTTTHNT